MDNSIDDDLELLKPPVSDDDEPENQRSPALDQQASVNPSFFHRHTQSLDESIDPASIHALQTAFSSLQKKHNDQARRYHELQQKNKIMQKALMSVELQGEFKTYSEMDEIYANDPGMAHAAGAGGASEAETVIAESRAKQGYILHLEKELMRNNSAISKGNEEIGRLKKKLDELEKEKNGYIQNRDRLCSDLEMLSHQLEAMNVDNIKKDQEIKMLNGRMQTEDLSRQSLTEANKCLREKIQVYERADFTSNNKEAEIKDLNSKLNVADNELKKLVIQFREVDQKLKNKEREVSVLEAKCNQFEIQVDISRKQNEQRVAISVDTDEVDGDINILTQALRILETQRGEIRGLKDQVEQQHKLIQGITDIKGLSLQSTEKPFIEARPTAQGASMHIFRDDYNRNTVQAPGGTIYQQNTMNQKNDYRGLSLMPQMTSPKINAIVKHTGHKQIVEMTPEVSRPGMKRNTAINTFDCVQNQNTSPVNTTSQIQYSNGSAGPSTEVRRNNTGIEYGKSNSPNLDTRQNSPNRKVGICNPNTELTKEAPNMETYNRGASGEYYNTSPRTRTDEPSFVPQSAFMAAVGQPKYENIEAGARPRVPSSDTNYLNLQYSEQKPQSPVNRIPNRMTQSEIIMRNPQSNGNMELMSRSILSPLKPLNIPTNTVPRSNLSSLFSPSVAVTGVSPRREQSEHVYVNDHSGQNNGPDYENIFNIKEQTEIKRPLDEHEDTAFVNTNPNKSPNNFEVSANRTTITDNPPQEEGSDISDVSALKVCPVCSEEFSRLTMDQFQTHVFECFDNCEEGPTTLQPSGGGNDDDRNCPMCGAVFPLTIAQETFEQHVLGHFGEEPMIDRFELLNP